jgi:hypothetical protein
VFVHVGGKVASRMVLQPSIGVCCQENLKLVEEDSSHKYLLIEQ